ncbi:MAG: hypothetical protein IJ324_05120 [Lachnospiraceae bacterium]|nr:hypothetical protein [Lachnospiraceae bacterium]
MFFKKRYQLDVQSADRTLQSVFAACDVEPNTMPFDKLILREKAHLAPYNRRITATLMILLITLATPFLFFFFYNESGKVHVITLEQHYVDNNVLYIKVDPCHGSIDRNNSYLITASGKKITALSYDSDNHILAFPYLTEECNIYIPGENNSTLHLLYTPLP